MRQNRIIIYGFNQFAKQTAKILRQKLYRVIIIEEDPILAEEARKLGFEIKNMSLMYDDNIKEAKIDHKRVKAFFCLDTDHSKNLFIILSVRNLNKNVKIIAISTNNDNDKAIFLAGANKVINPSEIGALRIAKHLHKPLLLNVLDELLFKNSDIDIEEITIQENTIFDGVYLDDLKHIDNKNVVILGIQDKEISDEFIFFSTGMNHKIDAGDTLVVLGHFQDLQKFRHMTNHMI